MVRCWLCSLITCTRHLYFLGRILFVRRSMGTIWRRSGNRGVRKSARAGTARAVLRLVSLVLSSGRRCGCRLVCLWHPVHRCSKRRESIDCNRGRARPQCCTFARVRLCRRLVSHNDSQYRKIRALSYESCGCRRRGVCSLPSSPSNE